MPRSTKRRIVFYIDARTLERFLAEFPPERRNAIGKQAFESWLAGNRDSMKTEMAELRKRKMLMDLQEKEETGDLRKRKLAAETAIAEYNASCLAVAGPNPSAAAKAVMKTRTRQIREGIREDTAEPRGSIDPHDRHNNRLFCPECGVLFLLADTKESVSDAKERYTDHIFKKHERTLTGREVEVLQKL